VRKVWILALLLLTACGSKQASGVARSPASAGSTLSAPASTQPNYPSASPDHLNGDLPVEVVIQGQLQAGFLHFPDDTFHRDAAADSVLPAFASGSLRDNLLTYDIAVHRWLAVARTQLSPDGLRYAYRESVFPPAPASPPKGQAPLPRARESTTGT
jgi:hypothetical protein